MVTKVFWTGATRSGCVGQFKDCFLGVYDYDNFFDGDILYNEGGGACVSVILYGEELIAKTMPCESKGFLACQGDSTIHTAADATVMRPVMQFMPRFYLN